MRVAFLTPEFVTDNRDAGGLATYVAKMALAIQESGHVAEVFTIGEESYVNDYAGIRVETLPPSSCLPWRVARRIHRMLPLFPFGGTLFQLRCASALAEAMENRHRQNPFDCIQSSNFGLAGLFVGRRTDRIHVVRCSSSRSGRKAVSKGQLTWDVRLQEWLTHLQIHRADRSYAPSQFLADYYASHHSLKLAVVRPPVALNVKLALETPVEMPSRYLLHVGTLGHTKGSDIIAKALGIAWQRCPELTMVWAGRESSVGFVKSCFATVPDPLRFRWLGPLPRETVYRVMSGAEAVVLPSRFDNLPNTAIESLSLGVPVVASRGASVDELVEDGVNGAVVPVEDAGELASVMCRVWHNDPPWGARPVPQPRIFSEMQPARAVENFFRFAGIASNVSSHTLRPA